MSFAEIARLPQEQQDDIIEGMRDEQIDAFAAYFDARGKMAEQELKILDARLQAKDQKQQEIRAANIQKMQQLLVQ